MKIAILAVGLKGEVFVERLLAESPDVVLVCSYGSSRAIRDMADAARVPYLRAVSPTVPDDVDLVLVVGWQWLLDVDSRYVVFHDSRLPALRGFCPMATALIRGDQWVGVTALRPTGDEADTGPILLQRELLVQYPAKLRPLLEWAGKAMSAMALDIIADPLGLLKPREQDHSLATYSIWRDEADLQVDWTQTARQIRRFVDALGDPYPGAWIDAQVVERFTLERLRVVEVEVLPDRVFGIRQPGKLWLRDEVVCGEGMIRLVRLEDRQGCKVKLGKLKQRI